MKLYELTKQMVTLEAMVESESSSPTDNLVEAEKFLNQVMLERADKIEGCVALLKNWEALKVAIKAEEDALAARRASLDARIDWLENYVGFCLQPGEKFESSRCKLSWRKSQSVTIVDESKIPQEYTEEVTERKINKMVIKDALKSGKEVPGAVLLTKNNLVIK